MSDSPSPDLYWARLLSCLLPQDAPPVQRAYHLAWHAHQGQVRDGDVPEPYLSHPLRVGLILAQEVGRRDDPLLLCVALLHDVLEDSDLPATLIAHRCGAEVAKAVQILTKPPLRGDRAARDDRYFGAIAGAPLRVRLVKCADRVDNLRSMHQLAQPHRLARYVSETQRYLLPIAATTDATLHAALVALCEGGDIG